LLYLWLIKNIIVSGCAIYPVKISCIQSLPWTNIQQTVNANIESNAWSKGWPDRMDKNISIEEFSKNLNWLRAWSNKHLKYILNILIPYMAILVLIILYIKIKFKSIIKKNNKELNVRFLICLLTSSTGTLAFFFFFPLYRYGYSYIVTTISLLFIFLIKDKLAFKESIPVFKFIFISCFIIMISKQGVRIFNNYKNSPWPNIYTLDSAGKIYPKAKIKINNEFYYLADKGDQLCMYSKSPCTSYRQAKLKYSLKKTYSFFTLN
jgi:hypothetical protein